jgi:hypothetical protein
MAKDQFRRKHDSTRGTRNRVATPGDAPRATGRTRAKPEAASRKRGVHIGLLMFDGAQTAKLGEVLTASKAKSPLTDAATKARALAVLLETSAVYVDVLEDGPERRCLVRVLDDVWRTFFGRTDQDKLTCLFTAVEFASRKRQLCLALLAGPVPPGFTDAPDELAWWRMEDGWGQLALSRFAPFYPNEAKRLSPALVEEATRAWLDGRRPAKDTPRRAKWVVAAELAKHIGASRADAESLRRMWRLRRPPEPVGDPLGGLRGSLP